ALARAGARAPDRLCHAQAVAGRASAVARQQLLGRRADVRADQVGAGLEAAVGDDDGWRSEPGGARGRVRLDLDPARTKRQRAGTHPAQQPALPPPQGLFETLQRNVAGIYAPVAAGPFAPWRGY